jgi:hypothetical protein
MKTYFSALRSSLNQNLFDMWMKVVQLKTFIGKSNCIHVSRKDFLGNLMV